MSDTKRHVRVVQGRGFVLVDCPPYKGRVTEKGCVERWTKARNVVEHPKAGMGAIENAQHSSMYHYCKTCPLGSLRAKTTKVTVTKRRGNPYTPKGAKSK